MCMSRLLFTAWSGGWGLWPFMPCALGTKGKVLEGAGCGWGKEPHCTQAHTFLQWACFLAKLKISPKSRAPSEENALLINLFAQEFKVFLKQLRGNCFEQILMLVFCKHLNVVCAAWSPLCLAFFSLTARLDGMKSAWYLWMTSDHEAGSICYQLGCLPGTLPGICRELEKR